MKKPPLALIAFVLLLAGCAATTKVASSYRSGKLQFRQISAPDLAVIKAELAESEAAAAEVQARQTR